jgi:hypothetical protein
MALLSLFSSLCFYESLFSVMNFFKSNYTGQQILKHFLYLCWNMLLIDLFASMKLEKAHKNYLALVLKLCYHYDILRNRLKYYMERWIKQKNKYYSVEKNVFSRLILFRDNIYNVN